MIQFVILWSLNLFIETRARGPLAQRLEQCYFVCPRNVYLYNIELDMKWYVYDSF